MNEGKKLFALDIGTRSCVGIILEEPFPKQYVVTELLAIEHSERSMLDGQIHDVPAVSNIIAQMKAKMEKKHGPLTKVCVAAAGRALRTERAVFTVNISGKPIIEKQDILHLELSAVQQAQAAVASNEQENGPYYCVGYSVLHYLLDGEEIGSLIDQKGSTAAAEVIATFLPQVVVESLIAALNRAGLELGALTLEPIAAIHALIPPSVRRLNIALVDIGAGTSDIALTESSTVIAYGMVPIAGDEITEAICDEFLLDFPVAEKVKRLLGKKTVITLTDILGFESEANAEDIIAKLNPSIRKLSDAICDEILRLNRHQPPQAVMLVGGGSLTPSLPQMIAERLNLPENRVAIRGSDAISSVLCDAEVTKGPELVTPIGIALAAKTSPIQFHTVYVNEQSVRLFEVMKLTVGDCLLTAGIKINELYGKPGMAKIISLNGKAITIPGGFGGAPKITKNGIPASFDDPIESGDHIVVIKGKNGQEPRVTLYDLLDGFPERNVIINGQSYMIQAAVTCNGLPASEMQMIKDRDKIEYVFPETIEELLAALELKQELVKLRPFHLLLDGNDTYFPHFSGKLFRNGMEVKLTDRYSHLDELLIEGKRPLTVRELAEAKQLSLTQSIPVTFNGKKITLTKFMTEFYRGNELLNEDDLIFEGDEIQIKRQKHEEPFLFQDVLRNIQINIPKKATGRFILLKNNQQTTFMGKIEPGDDLKIVWPAK